MCLRDRTCCMQLSSVPLTDSRERRIRLGRLLAAHLAHTKAAEEYSNGLQRCCSLRDLVAMGAQHTFARCLLLSAIAIFGFAGTSHAKVLDGSMMGYFRHPSWEISSITNKGLRSVHKLSKAREDPIGGRRLLNTTNGGLCSWENGTCDISDAGEEELLSFFVIPFDKVLLAILGCDELTSKAECSEPECIWEDGKCVFVETSLKIGKECLGDAAVFLEVEEKGVTCKATYTTDAPCNADQDCTWDPDADECLVDAFKLLIGVPTINGLPVDFAELADQFEAWFQDAFLDANFADVNDILDWVPPQFECPPNTNRLVCDMIVSQTKVRVDEAYCATKYTNPFVKETCEADRSCRADPFQCTISLDTRNVGVQKGIALLLGKIENSLLRDLFVASSQCYTLEEADCTDMCAWDESNSECDLNNAMISLFLGKIVSENPETECQLLGAALESGCVEASASECESNPDCESDEEGECAPTASLLKEALLVRDERFANIIGNASQECSAKTTEETCQ